MSTSHDVDSLMKRTLASWYEDGLADLALGGYLLVLGAALLAQALTPDGSPLQMLWGTGIPLVLLLGGVAAGWILKRLKARLTYPRTGYVNFERHGAGASRYARIIAAMLLSAIIAAGTVVASGRLGNLSLIFGLLFGGVFLYLWQRLGLRRYLAVALWCLTAGIALMSLPLTMLQGGAAFWLLAGLGLAAAGLVAWRQFDRSAPQPEDADAGR